MLVGDYMSKFFKTLLEYIKVIVVTVIVTYCLLYFVQVSRVVGDSMEPNYSQNDIVLVNKIFYNTPEHNDIVVVRYEDEMIIKRVIGIGGDTIEVKDNQLYRNGILVEEDYILEDMVTSDFYIEIGEGELFVMGDNRNISLDSRIVGTFDFDEDVVGEVFFKLSF